jgi:hypothetical protein
VSRYHDQVAAALKAVTIRGPTRYAWLGRGSRPLAPSLDADLRDSERRSYLVSCLREELYSSFYCHGDPVPARWGSPEPVFADPWLARSLSEANTGRGSWEPGWTVQRVEEEQLVLTTARLSIRVAAGDYRTVGGAIRSGAAVSVRLPKELPALSPGFFTVVGDAVLDRASSLRVVRVYWNVTAAGAPMLVRALSAWLNTEGAPFRLKVADHPARFERCDAAILYLPGDTFKALRKTLREVGASLIARMRPQTPAFTLQFAPGLGLAEDNGAGESFGVRRCALLADAIVRAHERGIENPEARLDAVAARFAEDGVRIEAPYLDPSFADRHVL